MACPLWLSLLQQQRGVRAPSCCKSNTVELLLPWTLVGWGHISVAPTPFAPRAGPCSPTPSYTTEHPSPPTLPALLFWEVVAQCWCILHVQGALPTSLLQQRLS